MQILTAITSKELSLAQNHHILIDTTFLIDAFHYPSQFQEIIDTFHQSNTILTTIDAVKYEFVKGSGSIEKYRKKMEYYSSIINATIPITPPVIDQMHTLASILLKRAGSVSTTDILLLATLMIYSHADGKGKTMYLLSKDRSDIPISLFPIETSMAIDTNDNNCVYSFYFFNTEEYKNILEKRIREEKT